MSLSTLLEAAKYLDYLDSNNRQIPIRNAGPHGHFNSRYNNTQALASSYEDKTSTFDVGSFSSDVSLSSSPSSCPPATSMMMMAAASRAQPILSSSSSPPGPTMVAFQPPLGSSPTSSTSSYSRHRELHKTLEKNRRAHLRHCFEILKAELPASECVDKKTSHINIIRSAIRYILALKQEEVEMDSEIHRLKTILQLLPPCKSPEPEFTES